MKKVFYSILNHPYEKRYGYYSAVWKRPFIAVASARPYDPAIPKLLYPGGAGKQGTAVVKSVGSKERRTS
jgi:hypothetical protein